MTKQQLIFGLLEQADWNGISLKLLAYTVNLARNKHWRGLSGGVNGGAELINGVSCEDIVQEVVIKTLRGDRKWDPDKGELEPWLRDQIKSEISHLVESSVHKHERSDIEALDRQRTATTVASASAHFSAGAEAVVLQRIDFAAKVAAIYDATAGDSEVEEVVTAILYGCEAKPQALAEELGTDVLDINNRLKRLRRRIDKVYRT